MAKYLIILINFLIENKTSKIPIVLKSLSEVEQHIYESKHLPNIPSNDDGTWRRLEVVDFIARFVDDEKDVDEEKHIYLKKKNTDKPENPLN